MAVPPALRASRNFAEPVFDLPVIERVLAELLDDLMPVLEARRQGARSLTLAAYRVDGSVSPVTVAASVPSRDAGHLGRLFAERLERIDPGFGIDLLALAVGRAEAMTPVQRAWTTAGAAVPERQPLAPLIDRLINRFGPDRVLWREPHESHVPERAERRRSALGGPPSEALAWRADRPPRPLRLFAHPESVEVMAEVPDGPPVRFRWRRRLHDVKRVEGPERIEPEWWSDNDPGARGTRDYFRVEDTDGRRFWLYRDGLYDGAARTGPPRWYVHGLFA
jgi:protein ImuB